jgi:RimJ/RimL family protein N-acetyltransferase
MLARRLGPPSPSRPDPPVILRAVDAVVLETERLILRHLTMDDLDALAALYADPEVRCYFPEGKLTYDETRDALEWIIEVYYDRHGYGLRATLDKETRARIGRCGGRPSPVGRAGPAWT